MRYFVIETDDGLTITRADESGSPETAAEQQGGVLVDPTAYATYEDAYDALLLIESESQPDNVAEF